MHFTETKLKGAFIIDIDRKEDSRGYFARVFCQNELEENGLHPIIAQASIAFNHSKGTIRGMHFQYPPAPETKLIQCIKGSILDIIVDLRPESETFLQHIALELSEENHRGLYVPERFGHGYQVLRDNTVASYYIGEFHTPDVEGGLPYNDPRLNIKWPLPVSAISDKDRAWKTFDEIEGELIGRMGIK